MNCCPTNSDVVSVFIGAAGLTPGLQRVVKVPCEPHGTTDQLLLSTEAVRPYKTVSRITSPNSASRLRYPPHSITRSGDWQYKVAPWKDLGISLELSSWHELKCLPLPGWKKHSSIPMYLHTGWRMLSLAHYCIRTLLYTSEQAHSLRPTSSKQAQSSTLSLNHFLHSCHLRQV